MKIFIKSAGSDSFLQDYKWQGRDVLDVTAKEYKFITNNIENGRFVLRFGDNLIGVFLNNMKTKARKDYYNRPTRNSIAFIGNVKEKSKLIDIYNYIILNEEKIIRFFDEKIQNSKDEKFGFSADYGAIDKEFASIPYTVDDCQKAIDKYKVLKDTEENRFLFSRQIAGLKNKNIKKKVIITGGLLYKEDLNMIKPLMALVENLNDTEYFYLDARRNEYVKKVAIVSATVMAVALAAGLFILYSRFRKKRQRQNGEVS